MTPEKLTKKRVVSLFLALAMVMTLVPPPGRGSPGNARHGVFR